MYLCLTLFQTSPARVCCCKAVQNLLLPGSSNPAAARQAKPAAARQYKARFHQAVQNLLTSTRWVCGFLNHVTGLCEYCFSRSSRLSVDSTNLRERRRGRPPGHTYKFTLHACGCWFRCC